MPEQMRGAIVIPVRNRLDFLERCLCSLAEQPLAMDDWEVLVCDDGSTADISETVNRFRDSLPGLRLLRQPALGPAAARNLGFRSSDAAIFVCIDSDVTCAPDLVRRLVEALKLHPEWSGAEARIASMGKEGPLWDGPSSQAGGRYHTAAIAYRRDVLTRIGGFDESFKLPACEDIDLAARILQQGVIGYVPEAIAYHLTRRVSLKSYWRWRKVWKYVMILGKRYGFLAFPGRKIGKFPRLRVALAAVVTLPGGRFLHGCTHIAKNPKEGLLAALYSLFDIICGIFALPDILLAEVPPFRNYLLEKIPHES